VLIIYCYANTKEEGIELPIIMYHSVLKDTSRSGDYIVTPDTLKSDLEYIKAKGYTSITMTDLINYVYNDFSLPEKPIIVTFDDGHYNNLGYAVPLLKEYDMKAVISIVGEYTDKYSETGETNLNYSYLRWEDIKNMIEDGTIELQNHSYNLHSNTNGRNGSMKKYGETFETYTNIFTSDTMKLQNEFKENTGYLPNTYTYPFGAVSKGTTNILKEMGFKASLSCTSGVNIITKDKDCLFLLKRNNRPSFISSEKFFEKILK
jgi:peptidoglycan/xylan/chitin deacetylase (PgdA/CDA1 family)